MYYGYTINRWISAQGRVALLGKAEAYTTVKAGHEG